MTIDELIDTVGIDAALTLCEKYGGSRRYIATGAPSARGGVGTELESIIGAEKRSEFCDAFGGESVQFPTHQSVLLTQKKAMVQRLQADGMSVKQIARQHGVSAKTVRRWWLNKIK